MWKKLSNAAGDTGSTYVNETQCCESSEPSDRHFRTSSVLIESILTVTVPAERACEVHGFVEEALWSLAGMRVHQGKTQVWNQAGVEPPGCHTQVAGGGRVVRLVVVWRCAEELPIAPAEHGGVGHSFGPH